MYRAAKRTDEALGAFKVAAELTAGSEDAAEAIGARSWVFGTPDPSACGSNGAISSRNPDCTATRPRSTKPVGSSSPISRRRYFSAARRSCEPATKKKASRRIELSHWVALGNERLRGRFLDELIRRGEPAAIKGEISLILKAC